MDDKWYILTVLKTGGRYDVNDVFNLAAQLNRHKTHAIKIYCVNDLFETTKVLNSVHFIPMETNKWNGWWSKMLLFSPKILFYAPFLYMDLDTLIFGDYSSLFPEDVSQFVTLEDFYRKEKIGSGIMWIPDTDKMNYIWQHWIFNPDNWMRTLHGDQNFLEKIVKPDAFFQSYTNVIGSFKPLPGMKPIQERPEGKNVICLHGKPGIHEVIENYEWVRTNITQYNEV